MSLRAVGLLIVLSGGVCAASTAEQAQTAWTQRDQAGQTEKAIQLWQQALKENPDQPALWIDLTKGLGRMVRHSNKGSAQKKWADEALAASEQAIAKNPNRAEAWAYRAEALGQWANAHKGPGGLHKVKQAVESLKKALAINPKYAYAHMLLAEFYRQAPAHISVGDKRKALGEAQAAVDDGPQYAIDHIVLARALIDNGQKERAIAELREVLALTAPSDAIPETISDKETARDLLKELGASETNLTAPMACSENAPEGMACGK